MNEESQYKICVTKSEFETLIKITESKSDFYKSEQINGTEYILTFDTIEKVDELDELVKEQLVFQGFDRNYNPNWFGTNCENLIDKFYEILK
ncbi:hypothetical protein [Mangrovibacterium diazotrophicum]|uniref:Uncharacterized protein n=1 Tax=Mangrovibacterium diazotrophicum TaxID=1261403 RepID=A0A419VX40_9BACT|nr:hypothetical protein [Mangrovibacterium diazotrophicum]RKD87787.1 hypothetical protein BC643_3794 [Mangrovibacterium diazotrophicum]